MLCLKMSWKRNSRTEFRDGLHRRSQHCVGFPAYTPLLRYDLILRDSVTLLTFGANMPVVRALLLRFLMFCWHRHDMKSPCCAVCEWGLFTAVCELIGIVYWDVTLPDRVTIAIIAACPWLLRPFSFTCNFAINSFQGPQTGKGPGNEVGVFRFSAPSSIRTNIIPKVVDKPWTPQTSGLSEPLKSWPPIPGCFCRWATRSFPGHSRLAPGNPRERGWWRGCQCEGKSGKASSRYTVLNL